MRMLWVVLASLLALPALAEDQPDPPSGQGVGFEIGRSSIDTNRLGYQRGRLGFDIGRNLANSSLGGRFIFVASIGFPLGEMALTEGHMARLDAVAATIRERWQRPSLQIVGHAPALGDATAGARLSLRRAMAVAARLVEHGGLDPVSITIHGFVARSPQEAEGARVAGDEPLHGEQADRVDIYARSGPGVVEVR